MQKYSVEYWCEREGRWTQDFTSDDVFHIQSVFDNRQKPIKEKIRILSVEDVTNFFDL